MDEFAKSSGAPIQDSYERMWDEAKVKCKNSDSVGHDTYFMLIFSYQV